ncbi:DUF4760 domain-containing protein [Citrobacter portucalensis]|uniref:DUF4760 domain-containing protein n=1 Tax=Citrobacter portucalensis TaxID=1639133 RepID=UPI002433F640|nr:DUF4760 domain-containing protein [Citrobacter portucalensis]WFZ30384.1 DUF4760 domain-containing protein [Citrobacter portucalensis]WFZ35385.1 DUF4760 domain-containing protein [Citrobacter portucalensis]
MITNITTAKWFFPAFDAGLMLVFSSAVTLYCINRISKKFPDTNELLPFFGLIVWVLLIVGYYVVRYNDDYQTSLSIIVAGSIAGMGWWIQFITSAASDRRKHTLNVVLSTRTCTEYQTHLRNFTHLWRGNRHIPKELCEWRDDPDNPKFQNANVPKEVVDGINGMLYILNFFEFLAQGIKANDLDDKLLRECFCGFLEGLERRAYFILSEAQKKDERFFEGIVFLCKRWNNDKSIIEKHRHSAPPVDIGISYPPKDEVMEMLGMASHDHHSRKRRRRKTKKVTTTQPAANTSPLNSSQRASSG